MRSSFSHIVGALVIAVAAVAAYGAWYAFIQAKGTALVKLQQQINTKIDTVNHVATTRATLASIAGDEAIVQSYFVSEAGVVTLIDTLETQGKTHGSSVNVLSVSAAGTPAQPLLAFSLTITGTFDAIMRTIGSIEYAPYDLSIAALSLGQDTKNNWHADLRLSVGSRAASTTPSKP